MKKLFIILMASSVLFLQGCLLFNSIEYKITHNGAGGGKAEAIINDIRSDALNNKELEADKENLFDYLYKSDEIVILMEGNGKNLIDRKLFVDNGKLNGKVVFTFDSIKAVEGIIYEEPFYYLTLSPADSIISTNGEIMISDNYKRIMWDNSIKVLKFKMFSDFVEDGKLVNMAQYFEKE